MLARVPRWWLATLLEIVLSCFDLLVRELQSDFTSSGTLCRGWLYLPEGFTAISSSAGDDRNQVTLWEVLGSLMYRPGERLKDVSCPVQLVSGDADTCTPATSQRPWAQGRDNVAIGTGPFNHFGPFGRDSEASVAADIAFLRLRISRRNPGRGASKDDR